MNGFDIGPPPPEPEHQPVQEPAPTESFRDKALRRAQEEAMRQQIEALVDTALWWDFGKEETIYAV